MTEAASQERLNGPRSSGGLSPAATLTRATEYLARHGVDAPRRTAEILLMRVLKTDRAGLYRRREGLNSTEARLFGRLLCQRCTGTPLQYVVPEQQFMDLVLETKPGVFVPRPETEQLVEAALEVLAGGPAEPIVVDVGTGTGAIALAIKRFTSGARVLATDISLDAVNLAQANADRLNLDIGIRHGDLLDPLPSELRGRVDLLVSNPPYIGLEEYESLPSEVKAEPYEALVGGIEFHRRLADSALEWLAPGGWLMTEIGAGQGNEVKRLFAELLDRVEVLKDLAARDRVVRGSLKKLA
ncbi:MAG TPA: peptide chain release factor N(5)-glutamine methyltransferase [Actinomycetota bacterium]|nr:peptide chain release factor N(5)-glutamine methyltransferase [Actinomycetota bacterium]